MNTNLKSHYLRTFVFLSLWIALSDSLIAGAFVCPASAEISPCSCQLDKGLGVLACEGSQITENHVARCIDFTRAANNVSPSEKIDIQDFYLLQTNMTTFDLSTFLLVRAKALRIYFNPLLESIVGPDLTIHRGALEIGLLFIYGTDLDDNGLGDTLKYFSPEALLRLEIYYSRITGGRYSFTDERGESALEFLPGLSRLSNLSYLILEGNEIGAVFGGQFRKNTKLTRISLWANRKLRIGENAFLIDEPDQNFNTTLLIFLGYNGFLSTDFHCLNRMNPMRRPTKMLIGSEDNMDHLSAEFFMHYLSANPFNTLNIDYLNFNCDSRMIWLKENKYFFERRVEGCVCKNYPGDTCFNFPS